MADLPNVTVPSQNRVIFRVGAREVVVPAGENFVLEPTGQGEGTEIWMTLEKPWEMKAGVEPSVNEAKVPYNQFDKLGGQAVGAIGDIEFWFGAKGSAGPDHVLKNIRLVHVEPLETGLTTVPTDPDNPGKMRRFVSYRMYFADLREAWIPPRGGHLAVNDTINGPETQNVVSNRTLIELCLWKLGVAKADRQIDSFVDALPPVRNLEWRNNHPAEELRKLCDELGLVVCPQSGGKTVKVSVAGGDTAPSVPALRYLGGPLKLPGIDRRGKTVVFTTAPHPVLKREIFNLDSWDFVATAVVDPGTVLPGSMYPIRNDLTNAGWWPLRELPEINGQNPIAVLRSKFDGITEFRASLYKDQFYRYLRLRPNKRLAMLRSMIDDETLAHKNITVRAKIAVQGEDGQWSNSDDFVEIGTTVIIHQKSQDTRMVDSKSNPLDTIILGVGPRLVQTDDDDNPVSDREAAARELTVADLQVAVTYEKTETFAAAVQLEDDTGKKMPAFFWSGYRRGDGGSIEKLSDAELANALLDPQTLTIKDERIILEGGVRPSNMLAMERERELLAGRWLKGGNPPELHSVIGFFGVELSGAVASIKWDQAAARTDFEVNTWHLPTGLMTIGDLRNSLSGDEKFEKQAATQTARAAMGTAGAAEPASIQLPMASAPSAGDSSFWARLSGVETDTGTQVVRYKFIRQQQVNYQLVDVAPPAGQAKPTEEVWARHPGDPNQGRKLIVDQRVLLRPGKKDDAGEKVYYLVGPDGPQFAWLRIAAPFAAATWDAQGYSFVRQVRSGKGWVDQPGAAVEIGLRHPSGSKRMLKDTVVLAEDLGVDAAGVRMWSIVDTIEQAVIVRVNDFESGGGKYKGSILGKVSGSLTLAGEFSLASRDIGDVEGGAEDCLLFSAAEIGTDGTSRMLGKGTVVEGIIVGKASDGRKTVVTAGPSGVYPISDYFGTVYQTKGMHFPDQDFGTSFDDTTKILSLWWAGVSVKNCGADTLYTVGKKDAPLVLGPGLTFTNSAKKLEVAIGSTLPCLSFVADGCSLKLDAGDYDCISETFIKAGSLSFDGKYLCYTPVTITFIGKKVEGSQVCVTLCP